MLSGASETSHAGLPKGCGINKDPTVGSCGILQPRARKSTQRLLLVSTPVVAVNEDSRTAFRHIVYLPPACPVTYESAIENFTFISLVFISNSEEKIADTQTYCIIFSIFRYSFTAERLKSDVFFYRQTILPHTIPVILFQSQGTEAERTSKRYARITGV